MVIKQENDLTSEIKNTYPSFFKVQFFKVPDTYTTVYVDNKTIKILNECWTSSSDIATWDSKTGIVKIGDKIIPPKDTKTGTQYIYGNPIATIRPRQERDSDIIELSPNIISISGKSLYY